MTSRIRAVIVERVNLTVTVEKPVETTKQLKTSHSKARTPPPTGRARTGWFFHPLVRIEEMACRIRK
jgi:hypothetical protein